MQKTCGNPRGMGGVFLCSKNGISREEGWWGYGNSLELHIYF